jgi:predicted DNA-binding ribbon-helix-helix protein
MRRKRPFADLRPRAERNARIHPPRAARPAETDGRPSRSVAIGIRKTSVSLEQEFWEILGEIAQSRGLTRPQLVAAIDRERDAPNLTSAIRVFVVEALTRKER